MDHQQAIDLFTGYHDGDLDAAQKSALESHLDSCEDCKKEWQEYQKTMSEVSGLLNMVAPKDVVKAVETKIHRRSKGKFFGKQKKPNIQFALVSFILVLLFMLAYLMLTAVNEIIVLDHDTDSDDSSVGETNSKETEVTGPTERQ